MSHETPERRPRTDTAGHDDPTSTERTRRAADQSRPTIPPPADEQVVYRADADRAAVVGAQRPGFDILATIAGALAALGTFVLLSAIVGAIVGSIGYQRGVDGDDLGIGGLIAGLVVLFIACLVGGWVAGRLARRRGGLHGLVAALWLVVLAAVIAALAAVFGDDLDVRDQVGLPDWFNSDALGTTAIITGIIALALMLLGGWLGGRLGEKHQQTDRVELVGHRAGVRRHEGGIIAEGHR